MLTGKPPRNPVNPERQCSGSGKCEVRSVDLRTYRSAMKAMVLRAPSDLVVDEVARPQPAAGQVLVRITHSGVCGTDYKIFNGSIPVPYPLIPGHEMARRAGRIPATRVIIDPETYDGTCFYCQQGTDQSLSQRHADRPRRQRRLCGISPGAGDPGPPAA